MIIHSTITEDRLLKVIQSDEPIGFCIECGADNWGVEPDAREYECDECGCSAVFGAEEILFHFIG